MVVFVFADLFVKLCKFTIATKRLSVTNIHLSLHYKETNYLEFSFHNGRTLMKVDLHNKNTYTDHVQIKKLGSHRIE